MLGMGADLYENSQLKICKIGFLSLCNYSKQLVIADMVVFLNLVTQCSLILFAILCPYSTKSTHKQSASPNVGFIPSQCPLFFQHAAVLTAQRGLLLTLTSQCVLYGSQNKTHIFFSI